MPLFLRPPIFVVGCGHSGTSLMLAMLAEHPDIFAVPGETNFLFKRYPTLRILRFYLQMMRRGRKRWAEKTPRHIYKIPLMLKLNCKAQIICMVRDGRDVAVSIRIRHGDFDAACHRWVQDNAAILSLGATNNVLFVRYENLVRAPLDELSRICSFLEIEYRSEMMNFHKAPKQWYSATIEAPDKGHGMTHESYRNWQINQPLFDGSGRWKREMTAAEKMKFDSIASDMMIKLDYL